MPRVLVLFLTFVMATAGCLAQQSAPAPEGTEESAAFVAGWQFKDQDRDFSYDGQVLRMAATGDHLLLRLRVDERVAFGPLELSIIGPIDPAEGRERVFLLSLVPFRGSDAYHLGFFSPMEFGALHLEAQTLQIHRGIDDPQVTLFPADRSGATIRFDAPLFHIEKGEWLLLIAWSNLAKIDVSIDPFPQVELLGIPTQGTGCTLVRQSEMDSQAALMTGVGFLGPLGPQVSPHATFTTEIEHSIYLSHFRWTMTDDWSVNIDGPNETWSAGAEHSDNWEIFGYGFRRDAPGRYEITQEYVGLGSPMFYAICDHQVPQLDH